MNNDQQKFDSLYRTYAPQIYRYLLSIGCPAQEAEDIVQDTFVKALLKIDSFRGACKLSVWLCQIAKNSWLEQLRKVKREAPKELCAEDASAPHPHELLDLVFRLEEPYQSVFLRIAVNGWTYDALAEHYKKSVSWARVTYYRARQKLQEMLTDGRK